MNKFALLCLTVVGLLMTGCQLNPFAETSLTIKSKRADEKIKFSQAFYTYSEKNNLTLVLIDGPAEAPRAAATVRMFWRPKTGATPVDKTATNATIRYLVFHQNGQPSAAVYSGAGFLNPHTGPSDSTFQGDLWQANLKLVDAAEGFRDKLGISTIAGPIYAKKDEAQTQRLLRVLQQKISEGLGYPRLVHHEQNISTLRF